MNRFLLSVSLLIAASSLAGPHQRGADRPAPALGAFTQTVTIPVTVNGVDYRWTGPITFSPVSSEAVRALSGTGSFTQVNPPPPPLALAYLTMSPPSVLAGQGATVTIVLNRAPGTAVQIPLSSSSSSTASVSPTVTIQPTQTQGTAAVVTRPVAATTMVAISATYNGQSRSANLQVNPVAPPPPPPPPAATVTVQPAAAAPGGTVSVSWTNLANPTARDWVSLFVPGATADQYLDWAYTNGQSAGTVPLAIAAARVPGAYQLRLYRNNGNVLAATGPTVTVTSVTPPPPPPPPPPDGSPLIQRATKEDGSQLLWPIAAGTRIKALGTGFGMSAGRLFINGYPMAVSAWSDTAVTWTHAADATGSYPGVITVTRPDGKSYSGLFLKDGTPPVPEPPRFEGFYDAGGQKVTEALEGTVLTVKGEHFGTRGMLIYSQWAVCEIVSWTDTAIQFKVPFAWWDRHVSTVEVFPARDGQGNLSGVKSVWPALTVVPRQSLPPAAFRRPRREP